MTFDLGRVTTIKPCLIAQTPLIAVTFDLGRVTTTRTLRCRVRLNCGDVRSRTSYNPNHKLSVRPHNIAVTFDLGRVTTKVSSCSPS